MNKKEIKILDKAIQDLCYYQDRINITRQTLGINTDFTFLREVETIESLYEDVLERRKKFKSTFFFAGTSGWTVQYIRDNKKYKKNEKFSIQIFFSFVETDTFD